jgi:DNA-binding beta-propeller fold protein YncE
MPSRRMLLAIVLVGSSCKAGQTHRPATLQPALTVRSIALPGAPAEGVSMDYLAYDRAHHRVWVPAGNTGSVDVVDTSSGRVTQLEGFPTAEVVRRGTKRTVGPSSATVGDGFVFIGDRADSTICAVDAVSLERAGCIKLDSTPDGLAYVAATREVWATTPRAKSITIIDATSAGALTVKGSVTLDGEPEGYAVDDARGIFYTNLEDKDRTLAIGIKSRRITQTWLPGCGNDGPKGLALDARHDYLFVACTDRVELLGAGHQGKQLAQIDTGAGIDNIDYVPKRSELYAAAARAGQLTVARVGDRGTLAPLAVVPTAAGARNAVATDEGAAYLTDSPEGKLLVVVPAAW